MGAKGRANDDAGTESPNRPGASAMSSITTTASLFARPTRFAERSRWDFLTTLLATSSGTAQRAAPSRRRRAKPSAAADDGLVACGWFDSSQDLLQGLSVVETFPSKAAGAARAGGIIAP
jgi:hypothetical protein